MSDPRQQIAKQYRVVGRVQGVFFRASTRDEARRLRLAGWVANHPDGSVAAYACGDPTALESFERWLRHGPPHARVTDVTAVDAPVGELQGFTIR